MKILSSLPSAILLAFALSGYVAVRGFDWHPDPQDIAAWFFLSTVLICLRLVISALTAAERTGSSDA